MATLIQVGAALIVLGIIIFLHELGHFLVAKFFGIKVETFSVGFGPRVVGVRYGETDYRISAFPLGGYVKMTGEMPGETVTGDDREFMSKPRWQRFLVAAAGPAMNIVLAVGLLVGLFMYGTQMPDFLVGAAVVRTIEPGSPADEAGIQPGDQVLALAGEENPTWEVILNSVAINANQPLPVTLERAGKRVETSIKPIKREEHGYSGMLPLTMNMVNSVLAAGPGETAGLLPGDEIVALNGIDLVSSGRTIPETLQTIEENEFPIKVLRNGESKEFRIAPRTEGTKEGKPQKRIGVGLGFRRSTVMIKLGFQDAVNLAVKKNTDNAKLIVQVLGKLFMPKQSGGLSVNQLEGPIRMVGIVGDAYSNSWSDVIITMAMISLNLGLLNLLPIPILDGGVMLTLVIEGVARRELSLRFKERMVQVSFVGLLMLMAFVIYNDILKTAFKP